MAYTVPDLPYAHDALEPYIDSETMRFHHDKHHTTYVENLNKATQNNFTNQSILSRMESALLNPAICNNGGGHYNHSFFWKCMESPTKSSRMTLSPKLSAMIESSFGSLSHMKDEFEKQAAPGAVFGSGWVWLCVGNNFHELVICGTPNQDNPLMKGVKNTILYPILGLDVWEHAYYLKYQNMRPDYVKSFWNVVNWDQVGANLEYVLKHKEGVDV